MRSQRLGLGSNNSSAYRLDSVTLLIREDTVGTGILNLYSDNDGIPKLTAS